MRAYALIPCLLLLCGCVVAQPAPTPAASSSAPRIRTIASGERQRIDYFYYLNPDCTSAGNATIRIITPPAHGELTTEGGVDYPNFQKENQRYQCNLRKSPVINVSYRSNPGYLGADSASIEVGSPITAIINSYIYKITVK